MVLDASLLNTQNYKVWIKGKVEQPREGVAPSHTPWCSSYRKGSIRVTLDYCRQLYLVVVVIIYEKLPLEKIDFFRRSLSDNKSSQVFKTLLSILVDLINAMIELVLILPQILKSPVFPFLAIDPRAQLTIDVTLSFIFHGFFSQQDLSISLFFLFFFFNFLSVKSIWWQFLLFF